MAVTSCITENLVSGHRRGKATALAMVSTVLIAEEEFGFRHWGKCLLCQVAWITVNELLTQNTLSDLSSGGGKQWSLR